MAIQSSLIKTIYLYVFSGVGLALFLFGSYGAIRYAVNTTQFDKYPLEVWERQCDSYIMPGAPVTKPSEQPVATPSAEELQRQEQKCEENKEEQRKIKKVNDLTHTLALLVLGTLVFIPHWKLARKSS